METKIRSKFRSDNTRMAKMRAAIAEISACEIKKNKPEVCQLNLDCNVKPREANADAEEETGPDSEHQRLPLLRLRILRVRLYVRNVVCQCAVPRLGTGTLCPVPSAQSACSGAWPASNTRSNNANFPAITHDPFPNICL